jgi:hypothetical protein
MSQIFRPSTNYLARGSIVIVALLLGGLGLGAYEFQRSPWVTGAGVAPEQPVPFSHQHHVSGLGIDCRYCHTSVEKSSFAGIPPTKTCMNCHSQIWTNAPMLEPVRQSFRSGVPLMWTRVHDLPDFVHFQHDVHVAKGVGCASCHGPVDQMPLLYQYATLQMEWCLNCHRAPEKFLRPRSEVFNMTYQPPSADHPVTVDGKKYTDQISLGRDLLKLYKVRSVYDITSCSTCHY